MWVERTLKNGTDRIDPVAYTEETRNNEIQETIQVNSMPYCRKCLIIKELREIADGDLKIYDVKCEIPILTDS